MLVSMPDKMTLTSTHKIQSRIAAAWSPFSNISLVRGRSHQLSDNANMMWYRGCDMAEKLGAPNHE